jgi:hypothetical protein
MEAFQFLFRTTIQSVVIGVWSLLLVLLLLGLVGRTLRWVWRGLHPVRALVRSSSSDDEVVEAEWVREL